MNNRIMQATACAIGISLAAVAASSAQTALFANPTPVAQTEAEWAKDVTALAIAPDGSWGTATDASFDQALARAIAHCRSKYRHAIGCGYRSTSIRAGWSLAIRCGQDNIIVAARTLHAAEQAAVDSELHLRRDYRPDLPPCVRMVSVDPNGGIIAPDVVPLLRLVMERGP